VSENPLLIRDDEMPNPYGIATVVVLDFDGNRSGLVQIEDSAASFDMDGDGDVERTGWVTRGDALLVLDRNRDGAVNDISEMSFNDQTGSGLEGLAGFDTNRDGMLSALDSGFAQFKLWFDNDSDGMTDAGELLSLSEAGVSQISLNGETLSNSPEAVPGGSAVYSAGSFVREDGMVGTFLEAGFAYDSEDPVVEIVDSGENPTVTSPDEPASDGSGSDAGSTPPTTGAKEPGQTSVTSEEFPKLEMEALSVAGRSRKYSLNVENGQLIMSLKEAKGVTDSRAGVVGPAAILSFRDRTVGILSPLVLDLDGDGLEVKSRRKSRAHFDMDGNGTSDDTGWVGKNDGFLVIDANGDGRIGSNAELSLLGLKADARSSLDALSALDSGQNGQIDAKDARFGELKVWRDRNGNGVTDGGELKTLGDHGIASIDLSARAVAAGKVKPGASTIVATSTFTRTDGSVGSAGDAALGFKPARSTPAASQDALALPLDDGLYGQIEQLRLGLGRNGLSERGLGHAYSLPAHIDPFDFFQRPPEEQVPAEASLGAAGEVVHHTQDLPREPLGTGNDGPAAAAEPLPPPALLDLRLAHMVQQMASFGVRSGEGEWSDRSNPQARFDYFAP